MPSLHTPLAALLALSLTLVGCSSASDSSVTAPAETNPTAPASYTAINADLGTHVYGPSVATSDFEGKVVVFEYWGDKCPPCIRAIPHLVEVQKKHGSDKLQIVANQVWTKDVNQAKQAWMNAGGNDSISVINHGKLEGASIRGVPHSFVFNANGELVWDGHPLDKKFDAAIEDAVKAIPTQG